MKKFLWIISAGVILLMLNGCESSEYRAFVKQYGSNERTYCDGKFLIKEKFLSPEAKAPQIYLINSQKCIKE